MLRLVEQTQNDTTACGQMSCNATLDNRQVGLYSDNNNNNDSINYSTAELMESKRFTVNVYGHVTMVVVLLTLVTNGFVCLVLLRKNMRTPTNLLLVAMAISDTLTGVFPIPTFFYFYTLGHYRDFTPYPWCYVNEVRYRGKYNVIIS